MPDEQSEHILCAAVKDVMESVVELLGKRRLFPSLILLYSAIDMLGSLCRPQSREDSTGEDFKEWVDRYMLPDSGLPATAEDLWAARCGLLHTNTPSSKNSRRGKAREVHYIRGDKDFAKYMQREMESTGDLKVVVDADEFFDAFINAAERFLREVHSVPEFREAVLGHASKCFSHYRYSVGPAKGDSSKA